MVNHNARAKTKKKGRGPKRHAETRTTIILTLLLTPPLLPGSLGGGVQRAATCSTRGEWMDEITTQERRRRGCRAREDGFLQTIAAIGCLGHELAEMALCAYNHREPMDG
jgi:hypothetical protein